MPQMMNPEANAPQPMPQAPAPQVGAGAGVQPQPNLMEQNPQPQTPFVKDGKEFAPPKFKNEQEAFLFGPTERPNDPIQNVRPTKLVPAPRDLEKYLDAFTEAARQPDAPEELHQFMRILNYEMGRTDA